MSDYNTDIAPGLSPGLGEAPKPAPVAPTNPELETSLFHTQNSLGSVIQRMSRGSYTPQEGYNPVDDLKSWADPEYFRNHGSTFLGSQSPAETQAIKAEIDQGVKDRAAIAASGWNGTVAGLRMGLVDPTMFLPAGKAVQLAREVTGAGRAADVAISLGKTAVMQSSAQESILQATQPERTLTESAINVGSSTLLAALIGSGGYALLAREGLVDKGIDSLDSARVKLSEHNGVMEPPREPVTANWEGNDAAYVAKHVSISGSEQRIRFGQGLEPTLISDQGGIKIYADSYKSNIYAVTNAKEIPDGGGVEIGPIIGTVKTERTSGNERVLNHAVVSPEFRRQGLATRMLAALESVNPDVKFDKTTGMVSAEGAATINAYNRANPAETGPSGNIADASLPPEPSPAGTGQAMAAGAAPSDTRNLSPVPYGLDSIPGVRTAVAKMFPNLDVLTNAVHPAKAALSEMVDTPIALMANKEGQTATRFGGPTIERELKQVREGLHWQADQEMLKQWGSYLEQKDGATFMQRQTGTAPAGKMSFDDFNAAVYDANSTGDTHPVPQVAAMAQWIRKNGLDPIKERALKSIEGFKETTSRPGESYAPRNWDKEKISANWNDYVGTWTDHLAGEQATKAQAKGRIEGLVQKLETARNSIEFSTKQLSKSGESDLFRSGFEQDLIRASATHDEMRAKIEQEIANWEGTSTAEAKAALKARAEAEQAREAKQAAGTSKSKGERLASADKAVDKAVKRILESERDLSRQELHARAEEIASRVIGTPEGRLPYDASNSGEAIPGQSDLRGHAAHREIDIPYEMAKPWLRRSATEALKSYTHSVLPDAMLAERFGGDPNLTIVMKDIESAYAAKRAEAKGEPAQNKLKSQMDSDIKNVAAMRDRIRGTFAYDPTMQGLARFSQNALKVNNIISSHGMAVASLPDFAGVAFRHGITSAFQDAWVPFASSLLDNEAWQAVKAAGDEWKAFGIGIETHSASRNHALSDIAEHYRPNSKFERALTWVSDKAFVANLLAPLTDIQKRMATNAVASNILRASEAVAGGKATQKQIQRLAEGNITEAQAARIWDQWSNNGGEKVKGVILPNMDKWTDQNAALAFRGAVGRDVDIAVVQPGYGEVPKFMSKPGFNVLVQYKKFTMSATQRILISNLQRRDAGTMAGMITAVGMGMLAYRINTMASGQKMATDLPTLFKEGISRGGILGVIDDSNSVVSKATGGKADIYRAIGADKPLSKFVSRDAASMFLGPTYGKMVNLMQVARGAAHPTEWNESDTHAARMMTLGTNFPYLPQMFDKVEQGANHAFGIPMKAKPQ